MDLLFIAWGFVFGVAITYIGFVLKPYKKDKIKYFVKRGDSSLELIEANLTKKRTKTLCSESYLFLYGLDSKDYDDLPQWSVKEVNLEDYGN